MQINEILKKLQEGSISMEDAESRLQGFVELGFAKVDTQREARNGYPEVIYGEGKTSQQIISIARELEKNKKTVLITRVDEYKAKEIDKFFDSGNYNKDARCYTINTKKKSNSSNYIAVITAGTSDIPIAEEAAITAEQFGNRVERVYDVGVAGIHRLFENIDLIKNAKVVIVIAGMEGALVSVVGGLVNIPVIAVPTSVGYGTNFQGITALLGMLNSCASGVTVVNIDNGFGAAYSASMINKIWDEHNE